MHGTNFIPPSPRINMIQFNALHSNEPTDTPIEWNIQPPAVYIKSQTSSPKIIPVISSKMGKPKHHHYQYNDD